MEKTELKNIVILATGGTIAGKAASGTQMTGYTAGAYSVADLLAGVPELGELAHISGEQLCNIDSSSITDALLLRLAQRCNELLAQNDVDGVVITHGTDTMEETAFFLNLTVKSAKPVVLVGAMRPATAVSADGPLNIINAVKVAVDAASAGQGVLVMMNDEIYSGRDVTKTNTANVATFKATNGGSLGFIVGGEVHYYYRSMRPHTLQSEFDVTGVTALPRVDIIYTHIGEDRVFVDAALAAGARGIIYAGSGMGSIHEAVEESLAEAVGRGVVVVRSSRTGSGIVAAGLERWQEQGFLYADNLNPQKARLLLQLGTFADAGAQRGAGDFQSLLKDKQQKSYQRAKPDDSFLVRFKILPSSVTVMVLGTLCLTGSALCFVNLASSEKILQLPAAVEHFNEQLAGVVGIVKGGVPQAGGVNLLLFGSLFQTGGVVITLPEAVGQCQIKIVLVFYGVFDFMTLAACLQYLVILGSPGYKVGFAAFVQRCQLLHHGRELNGLLHILSGNHAKIHRILSLFGIKMRFDKALDASAVGERFAVQLHCADFDNLGKEAARTADRALVGSKFKIND